MSTPITLRRRHPLDDLLATALMEATTPAVVEETLHSAGGPAC